MSLRNIFLLCLAFAVYNISYSQCPVGDVYLYYQSDVDTFIEDYGDCEVIEGSIFIGREVTDLSGITAIKRIEGSLVISYSDVQDISNFALLEYIGGNFEVENTVDLKSIEGLNKLHTIEGDFLIIHNYTTLKTITGFNALKRIGGNFQISENYHAIETIGSFDNLLNVEGWFLIRNNGLLQVITGFNKLIKIGTEFDISSFKGNLSIEINPLLTEINGFYSLTEVERNLEIGANPSLKKITGFFNLKRVRYLEIGASSDLTEIPDFEKLTIVEGIDISGTGLTVLDAFNNVIVMEGHLNIMYNEDLIIVSGFQQLTRIYGLELIKNTALKSLIGLSNIVESTGINIRLNESLENLQGLEKLFTVGILTGNAISIAGNESLSDCSALCNLLNNGNIIGSVSIGDNPSKCSSEAEVRENCIPDFDNDEILDDEDLDDDNDGIPDLVEQNGDPARDTDGDGYPDHMDLDSDGDGCYDVVEAGFTDDDNNGTLGSRPDNVDINGLITGASDGYTTPLDSDGNGIFDFQQKNNLNAGEDNSVQICFDSASIDLFEELQGSPDAGGTWDPKLHSGSGNFDPSKDASGVYIYSIDNWLCGIDSSKITVEVGRLNNAGENTSIQICKNDSPINLFEQIKGDPVQGGTWTSTSGNTTGIFDPSQDSGATFTYTVANGICTPGSSQLIVSVIDIPKAGENTSIIVSSNSEPVNLFDNLGGNPDLGGEWSPALSQGDAMFDPAKDIEGTYTYTVGNDRCGKASAEVIVTINLLPNAGQGGSVEICQNSNVIDLFETLTGNPDGGGTWSPAMSSGNGNFNPSIDPAGDYTYTVINDNGDKDFSEVKVTVNPLPNSGESAGLEVCVNAGPRDLFEILEGTPDEGGVWNPALASKDGIFDPAIDRAGIYTYTVFSNNCGISSSQVSVTKIEFQAIENYRIKLEEFSQNNSIEVLIQSDLLYEYSLDGINFQSSNLFSRLPGGFYTLYVREIDGCGMMQENIALLDYLKYFTPNNDGYHDTWNLIGTSNQKLSYIKIYDRFGKLLKTIDPKGNGWDGTFNGKIMPADDYWFEVVVSDQVVKKGSFSLLR